MEWLSLPCATVSRNFVSMLTGIGGRPVMRAIVALATCTCLFATASGVSGQTLTPTAPPPLSAPPAPSVPLPTPSAATLAPTAPPTAPPPPTPSVPSSAPSATPAPTSGGGAAAVVKLSSSTVGNWTVAAFSAPGSMDFDFCAAEVPYDSGITLGFRVTRSFEWNMALFNRSWTLNPGSQYPLTFSIDYSQPIGATAVAIGVTGVRVPLAPDAALFKRFMAGARLNVVSASQNFGFNLTDTSKMLPDLLSCVQSYVGAAPRTSNPFAP
jgi:hypothetical protein